MKISRPSLLLLTALLPGTAPAAGTTHTLYKCTDDTGLVLYTNQKTGNRNCVVLSVQVPGPPAGGRTRGNGVSPAPTGGKAATPTPANFPRVTDSEQRNRDGDRRAILDRELAIEQANLDKVRAQTPASTDVRQAWQDSISLHERNIEALKKEIARLH